MSTKQIDVEELFRNAQADQSLLSTINIDELLETLEKNNTDYLENKTLDSISQEVAATCLNLGVPRERAMDLCDKLIGYRQVNEIHELHKGKLVKTVKMVDGQARIQLKGIVMNIKFLDNGTHILCMNPQRKFSQYKFDEYITFQQLSTEEQLILMAYEYVEKHE